MKYKKILNNLYDENQQEGEPYLKTKKAFVSVFIFNFTTYDNEMDEIFCIKMIEVLDCILNENNFDYQDNRENYINYLLMVNMPFLFHKLEWSTSIRGAWFNDCKDGFYEIYGELVVKKSEIKLFIKELIEWLNEPTDNVLS
jgi:hypothetical protein